MREHKHSYLVTIVTRLSGFTFINQRDNRESTSLPKPGVCLRFVREIEYYQQDYYMSVLIVSFSRICWFLFLHSCWNTHTHILYL